MENLENGCGSGCRMKTRIGDSIRPDRIESLSVSAAPVKFFCGECGIDREEQIPLGRQIQAETPRQLFERLEQELQDPKSVLFEKEGALRSAIIMQRCPGFRGILRK